MSLKHDILKTLTENKGSSISGQSLAEGLGVSRAAVWKAIKALKDEGFHIESATNRGYSLAEDDDKLSLEGIRNSLGEGFESLHIQVFDEIDSTNTQAKKLAVSDFESGTCIVANRQTAGRGRLGRSFYSPKDSGIYISIIIKPEFDLSQGVLVTTAAACAVYRAIKEVCGLETDIKWVNDLYYEDRKICGILTEAISDFESGGIQAVVIGIGINAKEPDFVPEELQTKMGFLPAVDGFSRNRLAAGVIKHMLAVLEGIESREYLEDYKKRLMFMGKEILINKRAWGKETEGTGTPAVALDVDRDGGLLVEYEDGRRDVLSSGEISIRL